MKSLVCIAFFLPFLLIGQSVKKIVVRNNAGIIIEKYMVTKDHAALKHGDYFQYDAKGGKIFECAYYLGQKQGIAVSYDEKNYKISAIGIYSGGERIGIWEFYRDGKLLQKFNYSSNKLLINTDTLSRFKSQCITESGQINDSLRTQYPVYLGGYELVNQKLAEGLLLTYIDRGEKKPVNVTMKLTIDQAGEVINYQISSPLNEANNILIVEKMKGIPNYWVPAYFEGKTHTCTIELPLVIFI